MIDRSVDLTPSLSPSLSLIVPTYLLERLNGRLSLPWESRIVGVRVEDLLAWGGVLLEQSAFGLEALVEFLPHCDRSIRRSSRSNVEQEVHPLKHTRLQFSRCDSVHDERRHKDQHSSSQILWRVNSLWLPHIRTSLLHHQCARHLPRWSLPQRPSSKVLPHLSRVLEQHPFSESNRQLFATTTPLTNPPFRSSTTVSHSSLNLWLPTLVMRCDSSK